MRLSLRDNRRAWLGLGLLVVALVAAACMPGTPVSPDATAPPAASAVSTAPAATAAPPATSQSNVSDSAIQVGVDAAGNFYRGNPNAAVKLEEFSEFQ